jgi:5'-3' exoribonuclease 2
MNSVKDQLAKHISSMLDIISNTRNLCTFSEMEKLTLQLHTLFLSTSDNSNAACKESDAA